VPHLELATVLDGQLPTLTTPECQGSAHHRRGPDLAGPPPRHLLDRLDHVD
jgi:hypothetical protein